MVLSPSNGYTATPHQRQNRRRERPGSRARRSVTRKSAIQTEFAEGILDAFDLDVQLPSDRPKPSPLLRQNFDQVWQKWKAREAEEKALAELDKAERELELQREKLRMFGGEADDDELYRMGILYEDDNTTARNTLSNSFAVPSLSRHSSYVVRHVKPRRSRRRTQWHALDLYLSLSNLREDSEIARFLSSSTISRSNTRHWPSMAGSESQTPLVSADEDTSSPLSLPTPSVPASSSSLTSSFMTSLPSHALEEWTFIADSPDHTHPSIDDTPFSEPETWILLGDDL